MASLKAVAKKAGVTPKAVRGWLDREDLAGDCWDFSSGGYKIPPDIEEQIIQYYQEKQQNKGGEVSPQSTPGDFLVEEVGYLREQLAVKDEQIASLTLLLTDTHQLLGEAQRRLDMLEARNSSPKGYIGAEIGSQQATGAQQSPPVKAKRRLVRDFVTRLVGRE